MEFIRNGLLLLQETDTMIGDHALAPHLDSIDAWPFIIRRIIFENAAHETIFSLENRDPMLGTLATCQERATRGSADR